MEKSIIKKLKNCNKGITGIKNMGNRCYLNTAIQCLSNCWELTNYFLREEYKKDINRTNPIGTQGKLCEAYYDIIKKLWFGKEKYYIPKEFIKKIKEINDIYSDNIQQDTQEFLNFLINGFHDDLNKVNNIPYINNNENDNSKEDDYKSLEELYNFKRRNQSLLVDLFYGQFKSLIKCPKCENLKTKFETFLNVSLPIDSKEMPFGIICYFIFYNISIKPIQILLEFKNDYTVMALRNKISKILNIHPFSFMVEKMDKNGNLECFLNNKQFLFNNNDNLINNHDFYKDKGKYKGKYRIEDSSKVYFLFQFSPKEFYNFNYNQLINKTNINDFKIKDFENCLNEIKKNQNTLKNLFNEDYYENEENRLKKYTKMTYYENNNSLGRIENELNGIFSDKFRKEFIFVLIYIKIYIDNDVKKTKNIIFPRNIFLNKNSNCKEIHKTIFDYFKNICPPISFAQNFKNLNTDNENDNYDFHIKNNYPYRLRIINIMKEKNKPCIICKKKTCHNCLFPFSEEITLQNLIDKYPLNNKGLKIDNSYFYLSKNQRELNGNWNKDFSLEITFPSEKQKTIFHQLNDFESFNFELYKKEISEEIPLRKSFEYFTQWEDLSSNDYFCEKCNSNQNVKKKIQISLCPNIFIIQLKRFNNEKKLNIKVNFPIRGLDMRKFVLENKENKKNKEIQQNNNLIYDLFAVAYHIGNFGYGHYYSVCKNVFNKKWYKYDDNDVLEINENEIVNKDAYLLFYRKRNLENIIDLEYLYHSKFVNYENLLDDLNKNGNPNHLFQDD